MDLYLTSAEPGLSLQEMIDCDIKCGIEFEGFDSISQSDLNSLDISGMSSLEAELDLKTFGPLFDPLDHVDSMEVSDDSSQDEMHSVGSWMNMSSLNNYSLDPEHSVMVNPSTILPTKMPAHCHTNLPSHIPSSHLPIVSTTHNMFTKADLQSSGSAATVTTQVTVMRPTNINSLSPQTMVTSIGNSPQQSTPQFLSRPMNAMSHKLTNQHVVPQSITTASPTIQSAAVSRPSPVTPTNNRLKLSGKSRRDSKNNEERVFPKPGYSYSCLIALALKNSINGSLPVSEIYSFMCEHFPYFRTAPNGWKNSVRHNLSLNKCFEKIEKPVVSGNNQRKGCLWALNPAKAHKMDDEVQKWSKKDLPGIKDAMSYPEVLESLERGEMKFESTSGASSCSEDEDEDEEVDPLNVQDNNTPGSLKIFNSLTTPSMMTVAQRGLTPVIGQSQSNNRTQAILSQGQQMRNTVQHSNLISTSPGRNPVSTLMATSPGRTPVSTRVSTHQIQQQKTVLGFKRQAVVSSHEPEYILPHSTMTEISLQANGAILDDLGNEIKIEGELPNGVSSRSLVVRKLPGITPIRASNTVKANYVYSSTLSSPHQPNLNRLVLTNAKLS